MKLSEFIRLNEQEKRSTVLEQGVAIAQRQTAEQMIFLFQLSGYYVETYCSMETKEILEYRAIYKTDHLSTYLDHISIEGLLRE
jgi:hypothetical protein